MTDEEQGEDMNTMNTTGRMNALTTVVMGGRTRVRRRFLTVNVQTCRRKSLIVK
jgi:hypothetical protein